MATMATKMPFPEELELHSFLDLNLPVTDLDPFSAHTDWLNTLPSPNHSADVSENSLNGSGSSHYPFDDLFVATDTFPVGSKLDTPAAESPARIADFPLIPSQASFPAFFYFKCGGWFVRRSYYQPFVELFVRSVGFSSCKVLPSRADSDPWRTICLVKRSYLDVRMI
jgi:hypothetical protein